MCRDQDLVRRLRRGVVSALRRIYETYKADLLTVAAYVTGDPSAAEDVLHDVFLAFAARTDRLNARKSLRSYLVTCVTNRARDVMRAKHRRREGYAGGPDVVEGATSTPSSPPAEAVRREGARAVREALLALPQEQREVIALHLHGSLTFREIAERQGVSINTAQSRYRYGIERLRAVLDEET